MFYVSHSLRVFQSPKSWRAEAALLLPLIDDVRRRICDYLTSRYGEDWAVVDNELFEPPLELGKLKRYFTTLPPSSWEKHQWSNPIYLAWKIRNELAHYRPVPYTWFSDFWRSSTRIHSQRFQA